MSQQGKESSNPKTNQPMTSSNSNSKQRMIAIAAVIVAALLIVNGILLYSWLNQKQNFKEASAQLDETEQLKAELENQYNEALADLETMRTDNEELNLLIDQQQAELKDARDKIDRLLRTESDLKRARREIGNMKGQIEQYVAEINSLKEQNEYLTQENTDLQEKTSMLTTDLEQQKMTNEELAAAKAELVSTKENLEEQNKDLSKTVNYASVIKVSEIDVQGFKTKENGKATKRGSAKNIDQLQICFQTTVNEVARPGREQFFVRLINPVGETMAIEELGSGIMTSNKTNEKIRYTQIKEYDYAQDETQLCLMWEPNVSFQEGEYTVEVYNKGYLAGTGAFKLR